MQDIDLIIVNKPINNLELIKKAELNRTFKVHYTFLRCKAELESTELRVIYFGNWICY